MNLLLKLIILAAIVVGVVFLVLALTRSSESNTKVLTAKGIFTPCKTNFDCGMGFFCEIRDHPTTGICVIAPGGACYGNGGRNDVCYSGYYCDSQEGTCLKTE